MEIISTSRGLQDLNKEEDLPFNVGGDVVGALVPKDPFGEGLEAVAPPLRVVPEDPVCCCDEVVIAVLGVETAEVEDGIVVVEVSLVVSLEEKVWRGDGVVAVDVVVPVCSVLWFVAFVPVVQEVQAVTVCSCERNQRFTVQKIHFNINQFNSIICHNVPASLENLQTSFWRAEYLKPFATDLGNMLPESRNKGPVKYICPY